MLFASSAFAWGAYAADQAAGEDPSKDGYGYAVNSASAAAAEREALAQCRAHGNTGCKVLGSFQRCGSYASSSYNWGIGSGSTPRNAQNDARKACADNCEIVHSICE